MNKIFGFFKQKIVQAKIQNKKDLENLVNNVFYNDDSGYKSEIILQHLQKIKNNYMTWSILIANEASTGLYYSQLHNHNVCLKKVNAGKDSQQKIEKYNIVNEQMRKTHMQLKEIGDLSQSWVKNVSENMEKIKQKRIKKLQQKLKRQQQKKVKLSKSQNQNILTISQPQKQNNLMQLDTLQPTNQQQILIQVQKW